MNPEQRLRQDQQKAATHATRVDSSQTQALEFDTVDELLRFDSSQNLVPPAVADRLNHSLAKEPPPQRSWIKRIFG